MCVKRSFDRISVDGQLSTSDTVFALASGASGVRVEPETQDELRLGEALDALLRQLALEIVADGEGARRVGRIHVEGGFDAVEPGRALDRQLAAREDGAARRRPELRPHPPGRRPGVARRASRSWPTSRSRGSSSCRRETRSTSTPISCASSSGSCRAKRSSTSSRFPGEGGETEVFFSDLSPEYVTYNAEYSS